VKVRWGFGGLGVWGFGGLEVRTEGVSWGLDVEDYHFYGPGCQEEGDVFAEAVASTGDDDELFAPIPGMGIPIIERSSVQGAVADS